MGDLAMRRALGASRARALLGVVPRGGSALFAAAIVVGALVAPACVRAAFPATSNATILAAYAVAIAALAALLGVLFVAWTLRQDERRLVEVLRGE
jgi:hypothetical protein